MRQKGEGKTSLGLKIGERFMFFRKREGREGYSSCRSGGDNGSAAGCF